MYLTLLNGFEIPETRASLRQESATPFAPASHSWLETVAPSSTVLTFGTATGRPGVDAPSLGFGPPALLASAAPALNLGTATPLPASAATEPSSLPWASYNQIADYMIRRGYSFNLGDTGPAAKSNTIRYNLDGFSSDENGLNADGKKLARAAIDLYEEVLGIDFVETSGDAEIYFRDNQDFAFANTFLRGDTGYIRRSVINIPSFWLEYQGEEKIGGYTFQTYLHEIGHALGLRHPGPYGMGEYYYYVTSKDDPNYGRDSNVFLNDSWQASLMSYIDQRQNTEVDASFAFVITPMIADWKALGKLYGLSGEAFSGDTVWGFNTNVDNAALRNLRTNAKKKGFTIVDTDGVDKIDFSGFSHDQKIDLRENAISNVGGKRGNMLIAGGTIIENARSGEGDDTLQGNGADNNLVAGGGDDSLRAGEGKDTLLGGRGEDKLLGGNGADSLDGGKGKDELAGNNGADTLNGGGSRDTMQGGAGDDTYYVGGYGDVVIEHANNGKDRVIAFDDYNLSENVENLVFETDPERRYSHVPNRFKGIGNELDNEIVGARGNDKLFGEGGNDRLVADQGADYLSGGAGNDELFAGEGEFDDTLDGGQGIDWMQGGLGNDTFVVDHVADQIVEESGEGKADRVISHLPDYALPDHFERLKLEEGALSGTGNDLSNLITGNSEANTLLGGLGRDRIYAKGGDDSLRGGEDGDRLFGGEGDDLIRAGSGNDTLDGQAGDDKMYGSTGNDYFVISSSRDVIIEQYNEGRDQVESKINKYTLPDNVENLLITKNSAKAVGNGTDNIIDGKAPYQILKGEGGNDRLNGTNTFQVLKGGAGDDTISGGSYASIFGGPGDDRLKSGAFENTLQGGPGEDTFVFTSVRMYRWGNENHRVTDFQSGEDKLDLSKVQSPFGYGRRDFLELTWIDGAKFSGEAQEVRFHKGLLRIDANFDREIDAYIEIDVPTLSESDFIL